MEKRFTKIIDTGQGLGKLFEGSEFIDNVIYEFEISQEFIFLESIDRAQTDPIPGQKDLSGTIQLQSIMKDVSGKVCLLELPGNKTWIISIFSGDFLRRKYSFKSAPGNKSL